MYHLSQQLVAIREVQSVQRAAQLQGIIERERRKHGARKVKEAKERREKEMRNMLLVAETNRRDRGEIRRPVGHGKSVADAFCVCCSTIEILAS